MGNEVAILDERVDVSYSIEDEKDVLSDGVSALVNGLTELLCTTG